MSGVIAWTVFWFLVGASGERTKHI